MERIAYQGQTLTRWRVGRSTFLALPEKGARLVNWNLTLGDGSVRDVIYWPETGSLEDSWKTRGGNPILFPFSGRTFDHGDIHFWKDPSGVRRPMPMHGLARQAAFRVVNSDPTGFSAQWVPDEEARACYPYECEFTVTYRFESLGLTCEFSLRNLGKEPLPWSAGHHFYFTVPWTEGTARGDYLIRIPAGRRLRHAADGSLVPGPALQDEENLANPGLVDTLHTALRGNQAVFGEKGRPGDVTVSIGTAKVPPSDATFVTWTADEKSPFYCVEPWMGPPNAPENRTGLHFVQPGKAEIFTVSVRVR
jgi:galactose mutarotase-like enzyme